MTPISSRSSLRLPLVFLFCFIAMGAWSQSVSILSLTQNTVNPEISPCETETYQFTITLDQSASAGEELHLDLTLPASLSIQSTGALTGANVINFTGNLIEIEQITSTIISFDLVMEGGCELYNVVPAIPGGNPTIDFDVDASYILSGGGTSSTASISVSSGVSFAVLNLLSHPSHNFGQAVVNTCFDRRFQYENTSDVPFTGRIRFTDDVLAGSTSIEICSPPVIAYPPGASYCVISSGSTTTNAFIEVEVLTPIAQFDSIVFVDQARLIECVNTPDINDSRTEAGINYGCSLPCGGGNSTDLCTSSALDIITATVNQIIPLFQSRRMMVNEYNCPSVGGDMREYRITNTATDPLGFAEFLEIQIKRAGNNDNRSLSYLPETASVTSSSSVVTAMDQFGNPLTVELIAVGSPTGLYTNEPLVHTYIIRPFAVNDVFGPGATIDISYQTVTICPAPADYPVYFANGYVVSNDVILGGRFGRECYNDTYNFSPYHHSNYQFRSHAEANVNEQPSNLFSLSQTWINTTGPLLDDGITPQVQEYCISGTNFNISTLNANVFPQTVTDPDQVVLQVQFETGPGLNFTNINAIELRGSVFGSPVTIPQTGTPVSNFNPLTGVEIVDVFFKLPATFFEPNTTPASFSMLPEYAAQWQLTDEFEEFFQNSPFDVCVDLQPDCAEQSAFTNSTIIPAAERFFIHFNTNDPACGLTCPIPLTEATTNITITCPGCYVPGWNILSQSIERINFDQEDANDDNIPEFPITTASANPRTDRITTGDVFGVSLTARLTDGEVGLLLNPSVNDPWGDMIYGQLHLFGALMNDVTFLGAEGTYDLQGLGSPMPFVIAPQPITTTTGDWWIDFDQALLNASFTNPGDQLPSQGFDVNDVFTITLYFQLNVNPTASGFFATEDIATIMYMSATSFNGFPLGNPPKDDALNHPAFDLINNFTQADRDDLFLWCTGSQSGIVTVGFSDRNLPVALNNPCEKVLRLRTWGGAGQDVSGPVGIDESNTLAMNAFSHEVRDFMQMGEITFNIPLGFVVDRVEVQTKNLTDNAGTTEMNCGAISTIGPHVVTGTFVTTPVVLPGPIMANQLVLQPFNDFLYTGSTQQSCVNQLNMSMYDETKEYQFSVILKMDDCQDLVATGDMFPHSDYPITVNWLNHPDAPLIGGNANCDFNNLQDCPTRGELLETYTNPGSAFLSAPAIDIDLVSSPLNNTDPNHDLTFNLDMVLTSTNGFPNPATENFYMYFETACGTFSIDNFQWQGGNVNVPFEVFPGSGLYGLNAIGGASGPGAGPSFQLLDVLASYNCNGCTGDDVLTIYYGWDCDGFPVGPYPASLSGTCFASSVDIVIPESDADIQNVLVTTSNPLTPCSTETIFIELDATGSDPIEGTIVNVNIPTELNFVGGSAMLDLGGVIYPLGTPPFDLSTVLGTSFLSGSQPNGIISFDVEVGCDYTGGNIDVAVNAESYCGSSIQLNTSVSLPMGNINTTDNLSIGGLTAGAVNCTNYGSTITIDVVNNGTNPSAGGVHELVVTLPGSFTFISSGTNTETILLNSIGGLTTDAIPFQIENSVNPGCGIVNVQVELIQTESITCFGQTCNVTQTTDNAILPLDIELPQLDITSLTFDCGSVTIDVTNNSNLTATDWEIEFYCVTGSCSGTVLQTISNVTLNPGGTATFNTVLPVCSGCTEIMAVLQSTDGCECAPFQLNALDGGAGGVWHQTTSLADLNDSGEDIVTDPFGNVYVTGIFGNSTTFDDGQTAPVTITSASDNSMYVAKYNSCGQLLWVNHTVDGNTIGRGIALDEVTNTVYVVGVTVDGEFRDFPAGNIINTTQTAPLNDKPFVARYSMTDGSSNAPLYVAPTNPGQLIEFTTVKVGNNQDVFVGGKYGPYTGINAYNAKKYRSLVAKLEPVSAGATYDLRWAYVNAKSSPCRQCRTNDLELTIGAGGEENLWVTGTFKHNSDWVDFTSLPSINIINVPKGNNGQSIDAFLTRIDDQGMDADAMTFHEEGGVPIPGGHFAWGADVSIAPNGNIYFTGTFGNELDNAFGSGQQLLVANKWGAYLCGMDPSQNFIIVDMAETLTTNGQVQGRAVAADANGVYYAGIFRKSDVILPQNGTFTHTGPNNSYKMYYSGYDLTGVGGASGFGNVTEGPGDHRLRAMTANEAGALFSTGNYRGEMGYNNGLPVSGNLFATDGSGTVTTSQLNAFVVRTQTATGELRLHENPDLPLSGNDLSLDIYPNPNGGSFFIRFRQADDEQPVQIEITDITGKVVRTYTNVQNNMLQVDLSNITNGIYIVKLNSGESQAVSRVIIQH